MEGKNEKTKEVGGYSFIMFYQPMSVCELPEDGKGRAKRKNKIRTLALNVKKTKLKAYVLDGFLAGLGGFLFCLNSCSGFVEQAKGLKNRVLFIVFLPLL